MLLTIRREAPILATVDSCLPQVVVVGEPRRSDQTVKTLEEIGKKCRKLVGTMLVQA